MNEHEPLHPYRAAPRVAPYRRPFSWPAAASFAWVLLGSATMMLVANADPFPGRRQVFFGVAAIMSLGVAAALAILFRHQRDPVEVRPDGLFLAVLALPIGGVLAWFGAAIVHTAAYVPSYMGRRHRKGSRLYVADEAAGSAWIRGRATLDVPDAERSALGAEWRDNARKEHASVAAFSQLALDLMAVGAPPELVAAAHRDALDEVRHATACFALAHAIDGRDASPAPFPHARTQRRLHTFSRRLALTQIAVDALVDGVLNEGIAARLLAKLGSRCALPEMRAALGEMAADESRHASHSWDVVAWCVAEGGAFVASALRGAVRGMPEGVCSSLPERAREGAWEAWGVQGAAMEAEAYAKTRA